MFGKTKIVLGSEAKKVPNIMRQAGDLFLDLQRGIIQCHILT